MIGTVFAQRMSAIMNALRKFPFLRAVTAVALVAVTVELAGIWSELKGIRREQAKNVAYPPRPEQLSRLRSTATGQARLRVLARQSAVTLDPSEPLPVKIHR